jgi:cytosine/adenosine deaminase-related metal-dependent hydrolase
MKKITADKIYPIAAAPLEEQVVITDNAGKILSIEPRHHHPASEVEYHPGILIPGFVNTHCHLELSHMKGKIQTGTGLIPFIRQVVAQRNAPPEIIQAAIETAYAEMIAGGIVALGDISNTTDTFVVKAKGEMRTYTFVELFDFLQDTNATKALEDWQSVFQTLNPPNGSCKSMVPHAPYSVSPTLFNLIKQANGNEYNQTISIHNQETPPENQLFESKTGDFIDFYQTFGISLESFSANHKSSIYYAIQHLNPHNRNLFVHNTLTNREEVEAAQAWSTHVYWATCPNANLYIENRLPDYRVFLDTNARVCIGTDSLTSNWQLSILEELKTITRYQSYVPLETLLTWATLNGAKALGFEATLGSIEPGKQPGLLILSNLTDNGQIGPHTNVSRII